jgi:hypothetical protein
MSILQRIAGLEIEPGLAELSAALVADTLKVERELVAQQVVRRAIPGKVCSGFPSGIA